jgi:hypothetical protein
MKHEMPDAAPELRGYRNPAGNRKFNSRIL